MSQEGRRRRWVWVFGEVYGLQWVVDHGQMAFPPSAEPQARSTSLGDPVGARSRALHLPQPHERQGVTRGDSDGNRRVRPLGA